MSVSDYIRYHEAEKLFKLYPTLQIVLKSLQADLNNKDEIIYSKVVGNRNMDSMPPGGSISDKTGNLAVAIENNPERAKIIQDVCELSTVIDKLTYAITSIKRVQKIILETYYWSEEEATWKQVIEELTKNNLFMSISKAKKIRKSGIEYIAMVSKITIEQYNFVVDLLKLE